MRGERDNHDWARAAALNYISDRVNESRRVGTVDQMQARIRELDAKLSSAERIRLILEGDLEDAQARICELEVAMRELLAVESISDEIGKYCPWCGQVKVWDDVENCYIQRHTPDCPRQKAVKLVVEGK